MSNLEFSERALARFAEEPRLARERRDTELVITLWHEKASQLGSPPPVEAFDLSRAMDWSYRFYHLRCGYRRLGLPCVRVTLCPPARIA
jgi:hypothetical protein